MELRRASFVRDEARRFISGELVSAFGHMYPDWDIETAIAELSQDHGSGLPLHLFAMDSDSPLGIASIISDDEVTGWENRGWWLANVLVLPQYRAQGIGKSLINAASIIAASAGAKELHLVTDSAESWYLKHGWQTVGTGEVHGHQMQVMRRDLSYLSA